MTRKVHCAFDDEGVYVYQSLNPTIVKLAEETGTFGKNFDLGRTSWMKPNFAWHLHRAYVGNKNRMLAIARVKLHHWAWLEILENSVASHYDDNLHGDKMRWQIDLKRAQVISQWDPERGLDGKQLGRQSIQLGLKAAILPDYVARYIIRVEDASPLASTIAQLAKAGQMEFPPIPEEREYPIEESLSILLGCRDAD